MQRRPPSIPALVAIALSLTSAAAPAQWRDDTEGAAIYRVYCSFCHDDGTVGAPIVDDPEAWRNSVGKGAQALAQSAWDGHNLMPARAMRRELNLERVRTAVEYMLNRRGKAK